MGRPLEGKRVLVTRTAEQAEGFNQALRAAGAEPVLIPLIGFEATDNAAELDAALSVLSDYDAILLTSQNALSFFLAHAKRMDEDWVAKAPPAWCVGPSTLAAASEAGFRAEALAAGKRCSAERIARGWRDGGFAHHLPNGRRPARGETFDETTCGWRTRCADLRQPLCCSLFL